MFLAITWPLVQMLQPYHVRPTNDRTFDKEKIKILEDHLGLYVYSVGMELQGIDEFSSNYVVGKEIGCCNDDLTQYWLRHDLNTAKKFQFFF